MIIQTFVARSA